MTPSPDNMRLALGAFATGVTVVTARSPDQRPVAMTVSSFTGVSLSPPLVLWCVQRGVDPWREFAACSHFAVHVLQSDQQSLALHFAREIDDKFDGLSWAPGIENLPLLQDYAACFQCRTERQLDGGDHLILLGEVLSVDRRDSRPLVFHGGIMGSFAPFQSGQEPNS